MRSYLILRRLTVSTRKIRTDMSSWVGGGSEEDVVFHSENSKRIAVLNRPKALNALNLSMARKLYASLKKYDEPDSNVDLIIMKGEGKRSFCAGGDVRALWEPGQVGDEVRKYFTREEYMLDFLIANLRTPLIAILDGFTMGGGAGISIPCRFRVATENTLFSMPETAIGFFTDVGGGYFLPRLEGKLGLFLGLTGHRLIGRDTLCAGIATHYVESEKIPEMEKTLISLKPGETSTEDVLQVLNHFHEKSRKPHEFSLQPCLEEINNLFTAETMEEIMCNIEDKGSSWAKEQGKVLRKMSPTSLKVTKRQIESGKEMSLAEVFRMEYALSQRFFETSHDFFEGVRAVLVDKDGAPKWSPATLEEVSDHSLDQYFKPLQSNRELILGPAYAKL